MRKIIFLLILTFSFGALAQTNAQKAQKASVLINKQKTIVKNKLTIKFASLVEDSRCPRDVQCIQAGTARIIVELSKGKGKGQTFEVSVGSESKEAVYNGYTVQLIDLNPQPASNIRINRNGYTAIFQITKP